MKNKNRKWKLLLIINKIVKVKNGSTWLNGSLN
jgi:hypothetical protein